MGKNKEAELLYDLYMAAPEYAETYYVKPHKLSEEEDCKYINHLVKKFISVTDTLLKRESYREGDVEGYIGSAKNYFHQYYCAYARHPKCETAESKLALTKLSSVMAEAEAEIFELVRHRNEDIPLDMRELLDDPDIVEQLYQQPIHTVLSKCIPGIDAKAPSKPPFYISNTGRRYHVMDCPYCAGRKLKQVSDITLIKRGLKACPCVSQYEGETLRDQYVTVFVDESIRSVRLGTGMQNVGNYSYIMARGKFESEKRIKEANLVGKGIGMSYEDKSTSMIAQEAMARVLYELFFVYRFAGDVIIYTDNYCAADGWRKNKTLVRLAQLFRSVTINKISRKKNKTADKQCRERILVEMGIKELKEMTRKALFYDEAHKIIELEDTLNFNHALNDKVLCV